MCSEHTDLYLSSDSTSGRSSRIHLEKNWRAFSSFPCEGCISANPAKSPSVTLLSNDLPLLLQCLIDAVVTCTFVRYWPTKPCLRRSEQD